MKVNCSSDMAHDSELKEPSGTFPLKMLTFFVCCLSGARNLLRIKIRLFRMRTTITVGRRFPKINVRQDTHDNESQIF